MKPEEINIFSNTNFIQLHFMRDVDSYVYRGLIVTMHYCSLNSNLDEVNIDLLSSVETRCLRAI